LCIAQAIRRAGHEVEIVDLSYLIETRPDKFNFNNDSGIDYVLSKDFDFLGIGSVVSSYSYCERLVKKLREEKPSVPVMVGGSLGFPIKDLIIWKL
jgi:hypothetical protein